MRPDRYENRNKHNNIIIRVRPDEDRVEDRLLFVYAPTRHCRTRCTIKYYIHRTPSIMHLQSLF